MHCPRCQHPQEDGLEACQACGVVFSRWPPPPRPVQTAPEDGGTWLQDLLWPEPAGSAGAVLARAFALAVLALLTVRVLAAPLTGPEAMGFLHWIDLPFHEAGHFVFSPFGTFLHILGGTLGQLLVPLLVAGAFARQRDPFGAGVGLWWMGQSFVDCAPYIADARARQLLLISGETGQTDWEGHDWYQLLDRTGLLSLDLTLARFAWILGALLMAAALAWGVWTLRRQWPGRA
ncbi:hypothetical protein [Mesoterricola sediminis]|uniref:Uncharacterized protein n=1 Tax=Mesoterricola sediminis TaxID=2927980 RepID=A0AA48GWL7_9BACT|nr:hypothetical protein [Mesoterricola sediminis]BDU77005.1 hypothetical protein METESE_19630 [Mesoterricola sediminis]